ncbi:venom serine protease-like [Cimex lectularius]|uniref:Peptidase S1 domain-containing protein n=1 Tax=Cimex lectularius TaxID=79782 RepID=A0A8I6RMW3_CIMLE|nr:venom serine protease-like [Cimex lectularius]
MLKITFLILLYFFCTKCSGFESNCNCGWRNFGKIIGGEKSDDGEWPMMAALMSKPENVQFCGGTIISNHHVLTAGHCVHARYKKLPVSSFGVVFGINNLDEVKPSNIISPKKIIAHPNYVWPLSYDVAILVMKSIEFSHNIGPACLPLKKFNAVGKTLHHTGWGMVKAYGMGSRILKKTKLEGVDLDLCNSTFAQYEHLVKIREHHLCTYQPATSQCKGDSGGPILWDDPKTKRYYLVGLISFGWYSCDTPSVNVDVSYFVPWIYQILSTTGDDVCAFQEL